jgi:hypothetical protein
MAEVDTVFDCVSMVFRAREVHADVVPSLAGIGWGGGVGSCVGNGVGLLDHDRFFPEDWFWDYEGRCDLISRMWHQAVLIKCYEHVIVEGTAARYHLSRVLGEDSASRTRCTEGSWFRWKEVREERIGGID